MNPRYVRIWLVVSTLMSVLAIAGLADAIVAWVSFFQVAIDVYQDITRYPVALVNNYLPVKLPGWVADYLVIAALARGAAEGAVIIPADRRSGFYWFQVALGVGITLFWPVWILYLVGHYLIFLVIYFRRVHYLVKTYGSIYSPASPAGPLSPVADLHMKVLGMNIVAHFRVIFFFLVLLAINTVAVQVYQKL